MTCILINKNDTPGLRLFRSLAQSGRRNIRLISAEELVYAPSFECGFKNGKAFFSLRLHDGFWFTNDTVTSVINLIQYIPSTHIQYFNPKDREYVQSEQNAIYTFLFSILPHSVFNESTGSGLCGRQRSSMEWLRLAQQSGYNIPVLAYENCHLVHYSENASSKVQTILFFNGKSYWSGACNYPEATACCEKLGQLAEEKILEINFSITDHKPFFISAHTHPRFQNISHDFIEDLNSLLKW